jgi:hypothetical protein
VDRLAPLCGCHYSPREFFSFKSIKNPNVDYVVFFERVLFKFEITCILGCTKLINLTSTLINNAEKLNPQDLPSLSFLCSIEYNIFLVVILRVDGYNIVYTQCFVSYCLETLKCHFRILKNSLCVVEICFKSLAV